MPFISEVNRPDQRQHGVLSAMHAEFAKQHGGKRNHHGDNHDADGGG
jgi:hypothetical protein